jgi:hypothetical protein
MIEIVPARPQHIGPIASRMRAQDVDECYMHGYESPRAALRAAFLASTIIWTAKVDGRPEAMFGASPKSMVEGKGSIWMLGTDEVAKHPVALVRLGRLYARQLHDYFPVLENIVPAHSDQVIRWLARLGFAIGAVDVYNGRPIRGFRSCAFNLGD